MPNLKGLGLQNFRTFTAKEDLEFAPITLITGTNNAGKSSVFKAIQFLVHNFENGIVSESLDFKSMRHELGNLERIFNRVSMKAFKDAEISKSQNIYSRVSDFRKILVDHPDELPIFEENNDLVFAFPIKFGSGREITATLEIRYGLNRFVRNDTPGSQIITDEIKNIAVIKDGKYLHWSNLLGYMESYDDGPYWEMETSIDLKEIIQLLLDATIENNEEEFEPNEKTEDYFTVDLFTRIEKYGKIYFDLPFFNKKKDVYEGFIEKLSEGKYLFSDYAKLSPEEKIKLSKIEKEVTTKLLQGKNNTQGKVLECFKNSFSNILDGIERDIVSAELKKESFDNAPNSTEERELRNILKASVFQTTPNSQIFTTLLGAIEKDFSDAVGKTFESLNKVYFLPTTRGRNREWFIDEQNSEDIQIARDFSSIYLERHKQIQNFVNFWIGKGEISELDTNGNKKQNGFKIGKELSVFRDETIGLTKIFLVNFDGSRTPLVDLGYGVSQLLPIIMKIAIVAQKHQTTHEYDYNYQEGYNQRQTTFFSSSTILIEEPEANLHPSLQSKIAELFIDAASRFNIQFLLETHSEYLIYKFQEYIGQKIVSPSDFKMYYFNHPNDVKEGLRDKYINEVKIGDDGSIEYDKYFGKGFFDEQINLKLSLLNIQRDRFIEDYESIKKALIESGETLKEYDSKIEDLNQELLTTTSGRDELERQLHELERKKWEKESELQTLVEQQERKIDEYTAKADFSTYVTEIQNIIDPAKIDSSKTLRYLSTGKYLLNTLDSNDADFAPVIIQYGRAVEFEMIKWVTNFKNSLSPADKNNWSTEANYNHKIRQVFTDLGLTLINSSIYEISPSNKIDLFNLKNYVNSPSNNWPFGGLTQLFELLFYTAPANHPTYNYRSVPLMEAFSDYLKGIWADYDSAERIFDTCRNILDLRNCAGHTYNDSVCVNDIIDKSTAEIYVAKVEAIFRFL